MSHPTAQQHLRTIQQSVAVIERSLTRLKASLNGSPSSKFGPRRRLKLTPKRKAALKLHGQYLGHVRQLKPAQKATVKALKVAKGYHAAIALAKRLHG